MEEEKRLIWWLVCPDCGPEWHVADLGYEKVEKRDVARHTCSCGCKIIKHVGIDTGVRAELTKQTSCKKGLGSFVDKPKYLRNRYDNLLVYEPYVYAKAKMEAAKEDYDDHTSRCFQSRSTAGDERTLRLLKEYQEAIAEYIKAQDLKDQYEADWVDVFKMHIRD